MAQKEVEEMTDSEFEQFEERCDKAMELAESYIIDLIKSDETEDWNHSGIETTDNPNEIVVTISRRVAGKEVEHRIMVNIETKSVTL